jgi:hypothetical protein
LAADAAHRTAQTKVAMPAFSFMSCLVGEWLQAIVRPFLVSRDDRRHLVAGLATS